MRPITFLMGLVLLPAVAMASAAGDRALGQLADDYFDAWYFPNNPTAATQAGVHDYDDRLEDYSRAGVDREVAALHGYEQRLGAVDPAGLSVHAAGNRELLLSAVRSRLLTLEQIRPWEHDPDSYSSGLAEGAFVIMARRYAPPADRLRSLIARERLMPAALAAARGNLRNPPAIFTSIALEQLPGAISFFRDDVPAAFTEVDDPALRAGFADSNAAVIAALEDYQQWVRGDLLQRSHGDFRLGTKLFRRKLLVDEMVATPLPKLLQIGMADLRRNQQAFKRLAHELEPQRSASEVLAQLAADHPDPARLLQAFRDGLDGLIGFLHEHPIITIPAETRPIIEETPPFQRATTFASMDTPGPFERVATEAYFNVTLPDPAWDSASTAGYMAQFNYPVISSTIVHEAYPGHYIQYLWMNQLQDRVRALLGANSNAEGWAHYCEQMMLDEGFGQPGSGARDLREARLLRLGQLQDALLRNARYIVAIKLHTGGMSLAEAGDFFVKEGFQSRQTGEMETKRAAGDPTYLYYTLGKLQILKLRADLRRRQGAQFSLRAFHDDFMRQGFPPIGIVRRALLHDESPTL